jgi:hypothetical protein
LVFDDYCSHILIHCLEISLIHDRLAQGSTITKPDYPD